MAWSLGKEEHLPLPCSGGLEAGKTA